MKKTYQTPNTIVVNVVVNCAMLAGSQDAEVAGTQDNESALGRETGNRHYSVWDDDED